MDLSPLLPVATLVLGVVLTFFAGLLNGRISNRREETKAVKADESRRAAIGRDHATRALAVIRAAREESWKRRLETGDSALSLEGLELELAEAEIDLIPDPLLRPRLTSVLRTVRYPWTLANGSYSQGFPIDTQRDGLQLMREALSAYIREEVTPTASDDALAMLAKASDDADEERDEWEQENRERAAGSRRARARRQRDEAEARVTDA
jgi:hypothetical protein